MVRSSAVDRLERILETERACLLAGDIGRLDSLAADRERLLGTLRDESPDRDTLERLRQLAERNASLARAAGEGIRDAVRRLEAIRKAAGPIGSYGADGSRSAIGPARPNFEHKA